jgi:signal transduction histidine kinase
VASEGTPIARLPVNDLGVIDRGLAVLLTAGALVDAGALSEHGQPALAVVSCIALTGTVAWCRRAPVLAALVAVTALVVFQLASRDVGTGLFEDAAIIWVFYVLGRHGRGQDRVLVSVVELCGWLGACVAVGSVSPGGALDNTGGTLASTSLWALSGILPYALGRVLAARSALTRELQEAATRLQDEQDVRAQLAAAAERAKMARELHDVVAHCVSVMVVQTAGARRVARSDLGAARDALHVVEGAGREALVELRRIVGVLHRGDDDISRGVTPGLAHLDALLDRARAAGLPVELEIAGRHDRLPPGLDLVVYRVVQEALTNAIKHASPAHARVLLAFGAGELELRVSDSGRGPGSGPGDGSGHGLVGMSERVRLYGGELRAGAGPTGGFEVRARIPLDGSERTLRGLRGSSLDDERGPDVAVSDRITWGRLDPLLALVFLVALELVALTSGAHGQARFRDMVVLAAMALACVWRRRRPLWFVIIVVTLVFVLSGQVAPRSSIVTAIYVGLLPAYAVAAWEDRRNAWLGLAIVASASALGQMLLHHVGLGNYAGALFTICVAWAAGRAIRARRVAAATLERATARLAVERDDRAELAVAGERSRIARELHAVIAHSVAAMVIQTEAARRQLGEDPATADTALEAIQSTGRQALSEMRKILGVLRHQDDPGELVPQPGVDQIYRLIQRARDYGQSVELSVNGEPGALSAGVDLGIYRIVEDALNTIGRQPTTT